MILKILEKIILSIIPKGKQERVKGKFADTKYIVESNIILRFVLSVVFFPITLVVSLFKIILVWFLPISWPEYLYIIKHYIDDVTNGKLSHKVARKRANLTLELMTKGREEHVSFGNKNPDKTFFVIRPYYFMVRNELATSLSDLLFHYYRNLQQLSYALENGWIPVVDWENYGPFRHAEDYPINGKKNCWEYYWSQPSHYSLDEVYQSKNVVLANRNSVDYGYIPSMFFEAPYQRYAERLAVLCPKYDRMFKLNEETSNYIQTKQDELFPPNKRILGVAVRAMAYGSHVLKNHPIQPRFDQLVEEIKNALESWEMDYVYFSCESEEYVNRMRDIFGEKLLCLTRRRYKKEPEVGLKDDKNELYMAGRKFQTNLDYLTEMVLLSRCTALLASMTGGVRATIVWNRNKYEHIKILQGEAWEWSIEEKNTADT